MGINLKRDKLSFTKRETHVINMILNGYSIDEISRSLLISKKTVQSFVGIVLHKLNTTKISGIYRKKISSSTVLQGRSLHR
ncbi:LuxR C-terminal-related transcriptional regulator [Klebsiella pneumoniae]|uniref:LuxR C-terminal-related transcriptional regulator n=1 Tax=Klebsiella pneumoniae TaxID=573 RepID=UPI00388EE715